jgi:hypothetical protein
MMNEDNIIEQKELREKLIGRVEVLEKVKKLLLIPKTEFMSVQQVANYYEVGKEAIEAIYTRHSNELISDGMTNNCYKDFLNLQHESLETEKGKAIIKFNDGQSLIVPMRGLKVFPRRAILRVGMLLRDSEIAKEVRTQLLNIEEKTTNEVKTADITEEQSLALALGMAQASGDITAITIATGNLMAFKNRYIERLRQDNLVLETSNQSLKDDNKALAGDILKWKDRSKINFAIRKLSKLTGNSVGVLWNKLYKELVYKHHIDIKKRGDSPFIQHVKEDEWNKVIQSFSALCEDSNISPSKILKEV